MMISINIHSAVNIELTHIPLRGENLGYPGVIDSKYIVSMSFEKLCASARMRFHSDDFNLCTCAHKLESHDQANRQGSNL